MLNFVVKAKIIQLRELTHTDTSLLTDNNAENDEFWTSPETAIRNMWKLTMSEIDILRNAKRRVIYRVELGEVFKFSECSEMPIFLTFKGNEKW